MNIHYWQTHRHGMTITIERDDEEDYWIHIRSGPMNGSVMLDEDDLARLKTYLKQQIK